MGVIIYEEKGDKVESTHANRASSSFSFFFFSFFFWEEENRESKNLWVIPGNVAHCSKFLIIFFLIKWYLSTFFLIKGIENKGEKKLAKTNFKHRAY